MAQFRHKTIRRFKVWDFEFKDNLLTLTDKADIERFVDTVRKLPRSEQVNIVEVPDGHMAERPVSRVSRDNLATKDVKDVPTQAAAKADPPVTDSTPTKAEKAELASKSVDSKKS